MKTARWRTGISCGIGLFLTLAPLAGAQELVKTKDIANLAVTTPKIRNLAVTGAKLGNNAVTAAKIAAGAVTPDKISFYNHVIVVAPSGGDFTSPVDAMNAITDASETNPYLVKIMPGVYDIGGGTVQMKPYVSIEGSGPLATQIVGTQNTCDVDPENAANTRPRYGVVTGSGFSELRFLSVRNNGAGDGTCIVTAILAVDSDGMIITHVGAQARGGNRNVAIMARNTVEMEPVWISDVDAYAEGGTWSAAILVRGPYSSPSTEALLVAVLVNTTAAADEAPAGSEYGVVVANATAIISGGIANAEKAVGVDGGNALVQSTFLLGNIGVKNNSARPFPVVIANSMLLDGSTLTVDNGTLFMTNTNLGLSVSMLNSPTVTLQNSSVGPLTIDSGTLTATNSTFGGTVTVSGGTFKAANSSLAEPVTITGGTATCAAAVRTDTFAMLDGACQ